MRSGITQRAKRIEIGDGVFTDVRFHVLRLIHNDNGPGGLNKFNGPFAGQPVVGLVDDVFVFGKGVDVDDQNLDVIVVGKIAQGGNPFGIINQIIHRNPVVEILEMIESNLQILQHTFADGDGRDNDDEFFKAVFIVQLVDRPQIDIGFARAGFHFHGKIHAVESIRYRQAVYLLHVSNVFQNLLIAERQPVADPHTLKKRIAG